MLAALAFVHYDDLKNRMNCTRIVYFSKSSCMVQNSLRGKKLNKFCPPNRSNDLCLCFCLYPSSMAPSSLSYQMIPKTTYIFSFCIPNRVSHFRFWFFPFKAKRFLQSETKRNRNPFASFSLCLAKLIKHFIPSFRFLSLQFFRFVSIHFSIPVSFFTSLPQIILFGLLLDHRRMSYSRIV